MMNVLALGLLLTSVVTAGFFSPNPQNENSKQNVIVKEGRRVVVVEYEKDDQKTKIQISPQDHNSEESPHKIDEKKGYVTNAKEKLSGKMDDAKEKIKETSSSLLNEEEISSKFNPKELVCDAYGKCKHKIANIIGKSKETAAEKAHEAADKVYEVEEEAKEAVGEAIGRVKDTATHTAHKAYDKAKETTDKVTEKADATKEGAKRKVYDVLDSAKKVKDDVKKDAYEKMEGVKEKGKDAEEMVGIVKEKAKRGARKVKNEGEKGLSRVIGYLVNPAAGVLHLMGFAAAYGICVWITFASSYVLASVLPRQQFAMVQSKIYPVYFRVMASSVGMALFGHLMGFRKLFSPFSLNLLASLVMILVNMMYLEPRATKVMFERMKKEKEEGRGKESHSTDVSDRVVETVTVTENVGRGAAGGTATTTARVASQEKPEEATATAATVAIKSSQIDRLSEILRRLNSYSSFLNVLTLMSLTWHLVHLGQRLYTVC